MRRHTLLPDCGINVIMIVGVFRCSAQYRELEISKLRSILSRVSHELRTPLGLIRLYAETLEWDERMNIQNICSILKESERLSHLINNILNFRKWKRKPSTMHCRTNLEM